MHWLREEILKNAPRDNVGAGMVLRTDIASVVSYLEDEENKDSRWGFASETNKASESWDMGLGYEGALRMALDGWPEGRKALVESVARSGKRYGDQIQIEYDIQGVMPCVPTFLTGQPENMLQVTPQPVRPICRVSVEFLIPFKVDAIAQANYGAAILGAVESLELQGVTVELQGICSSYGDPSKTNYAVTWPLKTEGQALDIDRLAFTLGHTASSRRLVFGLVERCKELADCEDGYGYCGGGGMILDDVDIALPRVSNAIANGADFMDMENATKFVEGYFEANSQFSFH